MIKLRKFTIKDIVFLAIMAALLFLCTGLAMPLMAVNVFGLRNMATAIFYGVFATLALMKVPKTGALTLLGLFNAAILLMMSPVMFAATAASAFLAELIALAVFKNYDGERAVFFASALIIPISLPFTALFSMLINGLPLGEVVGASWWVLLTCLGTVAMSVAGSVVGRKIGRELRRAGKL